MKTTASPDPVHWNERTGDANVRRPGRIKRTAAVVGSVLSLGGLLGAGVATGTVQEIGHGIAVVAHGVAHPGDGYHAPKVIKTEKAHILNGTMLLQPGTKLELVPGPASRYQGSNAEVAAVVTQPLLVERPLVDMEGKNPKSVLAYEFRMPKNGAGIKQIDEGGGTQGVNPFYFGNGNRLLLPAAELDDNPGVSEYIPPNPNGDPSQAIYPFTEYVTDADGVIDYGSQSDVKPFGSNEPYVGVTAVPIPGGLSTAQFVQGRNEALGTTYQVPGN